jgi:hypothetical protein
MRRRLLWLAIVVPASFYLLFFFNEGIKSFGWWAPTVGAEGEAPTWFGRWTEGLHDTETIVSRAVPIIVALAIGLGVINLFGMHAATIVKRRKGWIYSVLVFLSFLVVTVALVWQFSVVNPRHHKVLDQTHDAWQKMARAQRLASVPERDAALAKLTESDWALIRERQNHEDAYRFQPRLFYVNYVNIPLLSTVMALLGFYITYAAYRAFRIRSLEATVMMVSAAVVILGSDPLGGWLTQGQLTRVADFDNTVLNSGMQRGLWLGIHVATIVACLRMLLGYERGIVEVAQSEE